MMTIAWLLARMFASGPAQRVAIVIECGLQNGTLAIVVAVLLLGGGPCDRTRGNLQPDHVRDRAHLYRSAAATPGRLTEAASASAGHGSVGPS